MAESMSVETSVEILGVHHVTAIASEPQRNIDFYAGVLGLRLVKLTVNFDDPTAYHMYYGDEAGRPGTILTFFIWPRLPKGRLGTGQVSVTSFSIPMHALDYWIGRLRRYGTVFERPLARFGEQVISFGDPDGLRLELVAQSEGFKGHGWKESPVPAEYAIRGIHAVTLRERSLDPTVSLLTEKLGFRHTGEEGNRVRYEADRGGPGAILDIVSSRNAPQSVVGGGTVHHVALRTPDGDRQRYLRQEIARLGLNTTDVIDRLYFHSVYFREPGGVLFEIATDQPGFTVDEPMGELGTSLKLPPWLESMRGPIEKSLPPVRLPVIQRKN